ncbi:MAG: nucleotidyl transferase AbiEii/AbiGii toxin family protein [Candidatus Marinimicrobia bacterium]|nr:nucleotidyl transferase AbiEii/AbiGii toxin family protein [Candidatus Neomarinimicrobiota bacterium]
MRTFSNAPKDRQQLIFTQTEARLGLPAISVEKDFWVCWVLDLLFHLPSCGVELTFKGGTSLSKGWQIINRFSEDIDIVINKGILGFSGENSPESAPTSSQEGKRLKRLKKACQQYINDRLEPELRAVLITALDSDHPWRLEADPKDPDHQTLLFTYPTVFPVGDAYIKRIVKIEMGARSDTVPVVDIEVNPYIFDAFPDLLRYSKVPVRAVAPKRTFWEKAMLLHEESFRPKDKGPRKSYLARHYYDLYKMIKVGIGQEASDDIDLFNRVAAHRRVYFNITWVDYNLLRPGQLHILPTAVQESDWRKDYTNMKDEMFFGLVPQFDEVLVAIEIFQNEFNRRAAL